MVNVEILSTDKEKFKNSNLVVYRITNLYDKEMFLVTDNWFTWSCDGKFIELNFGRTLMVKSVNVFGYFLPQLQLIKSKESIVKEINLQWPVKLNTIFNEQSYASPEKGVYRLKVIIGYGFTDAIGAQESLSVEDDVMKWQQLTTSNEYIIEI